VNRRRLTLLACVAAVGLTAAGTWWWFFGGAGIPVSEAEARRHLDKIVAAAQAHDFDRLCHLNGAVANCRWELNKVGADAVPPDPPQVVNTRYHHKETPDDTPGRILVVAGTDAKGRPYRTEVMVFRENRYQFKAINAVYWGNFNLIEKTAASSR
jgi:hypothetical protein